MLFWESCVKVLCCVKVENLLRCCCVKVVCVVAVCMLPCTQRASLAARIQKRATMGYGCITERWPRSQLTELIPNLQVLISFGLPNL